jgi:hypothetical protein
VPRNFSHHPKCQLLLLPEWIKEHGGRLCARQVMSKTPQETDIEAPLGKYMWLKDDAPDWTLYIRQALAPALDIREVTQRIRADLLVATYPAPWQVSADASDDAALRAAAGVDVGVVYHGDRPFEFLDEYLHEAGIAFCDASPEFRQAPHGEGLYFRRSPCFTREGHALYAQVLANFLVRSGRGPWRQESRSEDVRPPFAGRQTAPRRPGPSGN